MAISCQGHSRGLGVKLILFIVLSLVWTTGWSAPSGIFQRTRIASEGGYAQKPGLPWGVSQQAEEMGWRERQEAQPKAPAKSCGGMEWYDAMVRSWGWAHATLPKTVWGSLWATAPEHETAEQRCGKEGPTHTELFWGGLAGAWTEGEGGGLPRLSLTKHRPGILSSDFPSEDS